MDANTTRDTRLADTAYTWGACILGGVVAVVMLFNFANIGITGAVFLSALMTVIVGVFLTRALTGPLPPAGSIPAPTPAPAAKRAMPQDAAPRPTPAADTAPAAAAPQDAGEAAQPHALSAPREGGPDDLKQIRGVGPKMEETLHSMGYYHFDQIAAWTEQEVAWVDEHLEGVRGRASRDEWVAQAKDLAGK